MNNCKGAGLVISIALAAVWQCAAAANRIELSGVGIAPESLTSTSSGQIFIGSATRWIYRAEGGAKEATPWTQAPADGPPSLFGVFADERAQALWACAGSVPATTSELYSFDLKAGTLKARYPLPRAGGICNDIAVGDDGTVYVTDSPHMQVLRLRKNASRLETWAGTKPGTFGAGDGIIDGIAVLGKRVIVNTLVTRKLFSVTIDESGAAGEVVELTPDRTLHGPDGMRGIGGSTILVAETGARGSLARVTVDGLAARVETIRAEFDHGAVAVTLMDGVAWVLGNRSLQPAKPGEALRFEAVGVAIR